jgi:hypothetical protein
MGKCENHRNNWWMFQSLTRGSAMLIVLVKKKWGAEVVYPYSWAPSKQFILAANTSIQVGMGQNPVPL